MDQNLLVKSGSSLIRLLDETPAKPDIAMLVRFPETDTWKLWISPNKAVTDKREFYRIVAEQIETHPDETEGLDVSSTEYVAADSAPVKALKSLLSMPNLGTAHLSGNMVNGYYIPEGVAFRVR
jgi:hypothetical protein